MRPFDHHSPKTLPETLDLLAHHNGRAKVIAGGTDLIMQMRNGVLAPEVVINIKRLRELKGIAYDEKKGLRIGPLTTLREIRCSPLIRQRYPALSCAAGVMASEQIRAFATIGGNLCNGSPSADQAQPLLALDATLLVTDLQGEREISLNDFFLGPGETALKPGELLRSIHVPHSEGETLFIKHTPRAYMDISVVCIAIRAAMDGDVCQDVRIVLGAVAPTPMRARQAEAELAGKSLTPTQIARAAERAASECRPITDAKGTAWYRRQMVEVLVRRGLAGFII